MTTANEEKKLLCAILCRAILDYCQPRKSCESQGLLKGAANWLLCNKYDNKPGHFSFPWICHHLDLDISAVRAEVRRLKRQSVDLSMSGAFLSRLNHVLGDAWEQHQIAIKEEAMH